MKTSTRINLVLTVTIACWAMIGCSTEDELTSAVQQEAGIAQLKADFPQLKLLREGSRVTRIYGRAFALGNSAQNTAEAFRIKHAAALGVKAEDLRPADAFKSEVLSQRDSYTQPLMYDRTTGQYKFTLVNYAQHRDGIPVFRSNLGLAVRNDAGFPLVLATSSLRTLGDFVPETSTAKLRADLVKSISAVAAQRVDFKGEVIESAPSNLTNFTEPELVIWAGVDDEVVNPTLAVTYVGDNDDDPDAEKPEKWLFVADAANGDILHLENLIIFTDVEGNVSGMVTEGPKAMHCSPEAPAPFRYAQVSIDGGNSAYADANGNFVISNSGSGSTTVISNISGRRFYVENYRGSAQQLSMSVYPPGPADFMHNEENNDEFVIAQANGYANANEVRDWALSYNPSYPVIANQIDFLVSVNRTDGYCPGNAWYDGSSINFCSSNSTYGNTSFASISQHEYGHHMVGSGGSGQDEYGEGMSDCISMLVADHSGLGYGFFKSQCNSPLRSADNNCQYTASCSTCGSSSHDCGKLLSGCVWDIREELVITEPNDYLDIISSLTVNSILLHSGTSIKNDIPIDFLTLDDTDGNIYNGTPHWVEICTGFEAHGLDCPEIVVETGLGVGPAAGLQSEGNTGGPFIPDGIVYTLENFADTGINYSVTANEAWVSIGNSSGYLASGATTDVTISINSNAQDLDSGTYNDIIEFVNTTSHDGDTTRNVTLDIVNTRYSWNMDSDPGWDTEGLWAWGQPTGGGGQHGNSDPESAYSGSNVYGYNLSGDYENSLSETHLTSTAIDCTGFSNTTLRFWRWLGVEQPQYDHAYVRVSNNGNTWTTIWDNTVEVADSAWLLQEFDISQVADDQSTVYLRWTIGSTDSSWQYCGWNIDDVEIRADGADPICEVSLDCDDELYCNGAENCVDEACVPGSAPNCDDGVTCTNDSCNEGTDSCDNVADDASCNNGSYCDGAETCDAVSGCQPGLDVNCDDGIACTSDSCNETSDSCDNVPNNGLCGDGVYCNGAEVCDDALGCVTGSDPCPGQYCDEGSDTCYDCLADADCKDTLFCNGQESCNSSNQCQDGSNPCPGQECDEVNDQCIAGPVFADDFEGGNVLGWNLVGNGSTASTGDWEIGDPNGTVNGSDQAQPEDAYEGTGCAFTAQNTSIGSNDVDSGEIYLVSPVIDLSAASSAKLDYTRWFYNRDPGEDAGDFFRVDVSNDNGSNWVNLEMLDTNQNANSWTAMSFDLESYISFSSTMQVRFGAADGSSAGNIIEAAVDNVKVWVLGTAEPDCYDGILNQDEELIDCGGSWCDSCECLVDGDCDSGDLCNGAESCDSFGQCQPGTPMDCDDGIECTSDSCSAGACQHDASDCECEIDEHCDDFDSCTNDTCVNYSCQYEDTCGPTTLFSDGFSNLSNWTESGEGDWNVESYHTSSGYSGSSGAPGAHSDNCDSSCTIELGSSVNMTPYAEATLAFHRFVDSSLDNGEYLSVWVWNDSSWVQLAYWTNGSGDDNVWHFESFDVTAYMNANFKVRFQTKQSSSSEHVQIDDLEILVSGSSFCTSDTDCDDGIACTYDSCDEPTGDCGHTPDDGLCADDLFCNGVDICDISSGCMAGADPCPGQGCDEAADECIAGPVFEDDFESGNVMGWDFEGGGSTASTGDWEIGDPNGTSNGGEQAQPEYAYAGTGCVFTAQNSSIGSNDVDSGVIYLVSPAIDLSTVSSAELTYMRWFYNRDPGEDSGDFFVAEVSSDNGDSWVTIETLDTNQNANSWTAKSFPLQDYISLTSTVRVRFGAADGSSTGNIIEAAIDDIQVWGSGG
ncbi:MAG: hypothetical protein GY847_12870 [Proteobacteria bacterium]|nr:hypothetical protein [Pseudomonadota bacterium]